MSKTMTRAAGKLTGLALLFTMSFLSLPLVAPAAFPRTAYAAGLPRTGGSLRDGAAAPQSAGETQAIVVGTVALALIVAIAGAVLWYTSRHRRTFG